MADTIIETAGNEVSEARIDYGGLVKWGGSDGRCSFAKVLAST